MKKILSIVCGILLTASYASADVTIGDLPAKTSLDGDEKTMVWDGNTPYQTEVQTLTDSIDIPEYVSGPAGFDCSVDDSYAAESGTQYQTINAAWTAGCYRVFVMDGSYTLTGDLTLTDPSTPFALVGQSRDGVIIDTASTYIEFLDQDRTEFVQSTEKYYVDHASNKVYGTDTLFTTYGIDAGDLFCGWDAEADLTCAQIASVDDDTTITLDNVWPNQTFEYNPPTTDNRERFKYWAWYKPYNDVRFESFSIARGTNDEWVYAYGSSDPYRDSVVDRPYINNIRVIDGYQGSFIWEEWAFHRPIMENCISESDNDTYHSSPGGIFRHNLGFYPGTNKYGKHGVYYGSTMSSSFLGASWGDTGSRIFGAGFIETINRDLSGDDVVAVGNVMLDTSIELVEQLYWSLNLPGSLYLEGVESFTYDAVNGGITAVAPFYEINVNGASTLDKIVFDHANYDQADAETEGHAQGRVYFNTDDGTLDVMTNVEGVTIQVGQEVIIRVENAEVDTLSNGEVVYIFSAVADGVPSVKRAQNDNTHAESEALGLVTADISAGGKGFVTCMGKVRGIDTRGTNEGEVWALGDPLYVSDELGELTKVAPTSPDHAVPVGLVMAVGENNGIIFVAKPEHGIDLEEIHDVLITSGATGDLLVLDGTGTWVNRPADQTFTCPSSGDASLGSTTVTPITNYVEINNNDPDGCNVTLNEAGMYAGFKLDICVSSNTGGTVNFAEIAGAAELQGSVALGLEDCISVQYGDSLANPPSTWRETSRATSGDYAELLVQIGSSTSIADLGTGGTDWNTVPWGAVGEENGLADADAATETITTTRAGTWGANATISFSGSLSSTFRCVFSKNGTELTDHGFVRKLGTGGDVGSASLSGLLVSDTDDDWTVECSTPTGEDNKTMTIQAGNFHMRYVD